MAKLKDNFIKFLEDPEAWEMFITGQAGTGKTTSLKELVDYCIDQEINYLVCAHTHKACGVLRSKLPLGASVSTLWSFLNKRPTVNDDATNIKHLQGKVRTGECDEVSLLFVDEFSMVGEAELMDLRSLQDPDYEGVPNIKIVAIGDLNQLPPVGDMQTWIPGGDHWHKLTKIYRQADGNQLIETLTDLVAMIEGGELSALAENKNFVKDLEGDKLLSMYLSDKADNVFLCYTNEAVQQWNRELQGRDEPIPGDRLFSPTAHRYFDFVRELETDEIQYIDRLRDDPLFFNSKYKTLEHLLASGMARFFLVKDCENPDLEFVFPVVWGTYSAKLLRNDLGIAGVNANKTIEAKGHNPKSWAKNNYKHELARIRAKAWRNYFVFNETVLCMDFAHAMTIHKSQGSTFNNVYLDAQDLYKCAQNDFKLYLKLYYVALSRAANNVYTN